MKTLRNGESLACCTILTTNAGPTRPIIRCKVPRFWLSEAIPRT